MSAERPIVFLHLQKTGGTTVHDLLMERFPESRFIKRGRAAEIEMPSPEQRAGCIISGHVTARFVRELGADARVFTLLRDPAARLLSHFHFLKSFTRENLETYRSPLLMRIKEMNLTQFLADAEVIGWFQDFYVKHLDPEHGTQPGPPDVERALAFLRASEVVGITSKMGAFVKKMFARLDLPPASEIPYRNRWRDLPQKAGFEVIEAETPTPKHRAALQALTRNDKILFDYAVSVAQ